MFRDNVSQACILTPIQRLFFVHERVRINLISHEHGAYIKLLGHTFLVDCRRVRQDFITGQLIPRELKRFRDGYRHFSFLLPYMWGKALADGPAIFGAQRTL